MGRLTTGTSLEDLARQALVILLSLSVFSCGMGWKVRE